MRMFRQMDMSKTPAERGGYSPGDEVENTIKNLLAPLTPTVVASTSALGVVGKIHFKEIQNQASCIVLNHALNDYQLLINSLWDGNGRDAARISRSLYEHLLNYCYVSDSEDARDRYLDHEAVTNMLLGSANRGLTILQGKERQREVHRLNKLRRDSQAQYAKVIKRHGPRFPKDWATLNLHDRARKYGYLDQYDIYRLLSQVTHGSRGGTLGTYGEIDGRKVHRQGPSLDLAVFSYKEGLSFFRELLRQISNYTGIDTSEACRAANSLISRWPEYRLAAEWVDKNLWPNKPPAGLTAILAIYESGGCKWYIWDQLFGAIVPAVPPNDARTMEEQAKAEIGFKAHPGASGNLDGRPVTWAIPHLPLRPRKGAKWQPDIGILMPTQGPQTPDWVLAEAAPADTNAGD